MINMSDKVIRCPKDNKITLVLDCLNCDHLIQLRMAEVECSINFVTNKVIIRNPDDEALATT